MKPLLARIKEEKFARLEKNRKIFLSVSAFLVIVGLAFGINYLVKEPSKPPAQTSQPTVTVRQDLAEPKVELTLFAEGLPDPTAIVSRAGDKRLFILDRSGVIRAVGQDGKVASTPFLNISNRVLGDSEMGLLGMAFSPNYPKDGNVFINYIDKNQNTIIARYHASSADSVDPASEQKILTLKQPYTNHNGGALLFGPDSYLYAALGDGGSGGDPQNRAQNLNSYFGKILRLDVSQLPYKIPTSNPFAGQSGKLGEIWDYGLRNPWRISFDRKTGELYIADVGQGDLEEVNIESGGSSGGNNYGWRCYEAGRDYNLNGCGARSQYIFPILEYDHTDDRCSITGGYVYRGKKYPALNGKYFYGDYCGGQVYFANNESGKLTPVLVTKSPYKISTFGEDSQGELYLADFAAGNIYQVKDTAN